METVNFGFRFEIHLVNRFLGFFNLFNQHITWIFEANAKVHTKISSQNGH
jgi:hypothetical protein